VDDLAQRRPHEPDRLVGVESGDGKLVVRNVVRPDLAGSSTNSIREWCLSTTIPASYAGVA
jgi:hypothetical protein